MNKLDELSMMVVDGEIISKMDHIATIYINGRKYFNVYRRYNSEFNILIEDYNDDIYLHKDNTVRNSLHAILCLTYYDSNNIYTLDATSFKHNGPVPSLVPDIADMKWTDIHTKYHTVTVNFGGIFNDMNISDESQRNSRKRHIGDIDAANNLMNLSVPMFERRDFTNVPKRSRSNESFIILRNGRRIPKY